MNAVSIILLIVGAIFGGGIGWLIKTLLSNAKINSLKATIVQDQKDLAAKQTQLDQTSALLHDALSAIEVTQAYQAIDAQTAKDIVTIKQTFDQSGKATQASYDAMKKLLDQINQRNSGYNAGKVPTK
jgi:ABC-type Na+ efflux pump permease subunit